MGRKTALLTSSIVLGCLIAIGMLAQQTATEAPVGFSTPTVTQNPGSQSTSNGIPEPAGDTFAADQAQFARVHDPSTGLGPLFNAASCAQCDKNNARAPASQITELRVGHRDANGNFVNPTVPINGSAVSIT